MSGINSYGEFELPEEKSEVKVDIKQGASLSFILEKLHSDKSRIKFLEKIYTPGNVEVADLFLYLTRYEDTTILESELNYAIENKLEERTERLAKKIIDNYIQHHYDSLLKNLVEKCMNENVVEYAIKRLENFVNTTGDVERKEKLWECASEIAEHFGMEKKRKECLEKALEIALNDPKIEERKYYFSPAKTCEKLGKWEQAMELYLKCEHYFWDQALAIAKDHFKERVKEIAEKGYKKYKELGRTNLTFLEFAEATGKTQEAKEIILNRVRNANNITELNCLELFDCLMKLNELEEAKKLVEKIAENSHKLEIISEKDIADLYSKIGELKKAKNLYLNDINKRLKEGRRTENILSIMEHAFSQTKDKIFLEKKMEMYEQLALYDKAAQTANELGKQELAKIYSLMDGMAEGEKE